MIWQLFTRRAGVEPRHILLGCLFSFAKHGHEEVSLPEVLDTVSEVQTTLPLGYEFSRDVHYSGQLFSDLTELEESGYIRRYQYTHDGLLPKGYVALTMLGRGRAERTVEQMTPPMAEVINTAVQSAISRHADYWRLYPRI